MSQKLPKWCKSKQKYLPVRYRKQQICYSFTLLISYMVSNPFLVLLDFNFVGPNAFLPKFNRPLALTSERLLRKSHILHSTHLDTLESMLVLIRKFERIQKPADMDPHSFQKRVNCKSGNFRKNFIFANSVKRQSCGAKNSRLVHDLPISVNANS